MPGYWFRRHADALTKADRAQSPGQKAIYLELAAHYLSLHHSAGSAEEKGADAQ